MLDAVKTLLSKYNVEPWQLTTVVLYARKVEMRSPFLLSYIPVLHVLLITRTLSTVQYIVLIYR